MNKDFKVKPMLGPLGGRPFHRGAVSVDGHRTGPRWRTMTVPDGNLVVSFYRLDVFTSQAINWPIAKLLVANRRNAHGFCEGNIRNNTASAARVAAVGVEVPVKGVRIERVK